MTNTRFEEILSSLRYTDESPPTLLDHLWEIRWLIVSWNKNMDENFIPSWLNAINECWKPSSLLSNVHFRNTTKIAVQVLLLLTLFTFTFEPFLKL